MAGTDKKVKSDDLTWSAGKSSLISGMDEKGQKSALHDMAQLPTMDDDKNDAMKVLEKNLEGTQKGMFSSKGNSSEFEAVMEKLHQLNQFMDSNQVDVGTEGRLNRTNIDQADHMLDNLIAACNQYLNKNSHAKSISGKKRVSTVRMIANHAFANKNFMMNGLSSVRRMSSEQRANASWDTLMGAGRSKF